MEHFVVFLGHVFFLLLTRPNAHNKNFPYHVRTTQIGILEAMDANGQAGGGGGGGGGGSNGAAAPNGTTLDAFSHGGTYSVAEHATAMDIFTVDTVGSRRQYVPAVPPPYSAAAAASAANYGQSRSSPTWAENSTRKNSASAAVNGVAARGNDAATAGGGGSGNGRAARIYDPNESEDEEDETQH